MHGQPVFAGACAYHEGRSGRVRASVRPVGVRKSRPQPPDVRQQRLDQTAANDGRTTTSRRDRVPAFFDRMLRAGEGKILRKLT